MAVANCKVLFSLLLSADCGLDHKAEHPLLGQIIMVEDALEKTTCAEGTNPRLQGKNDRLAADQKKLALLNSYSEKKFSTKIQYFKQKFYLLTYLLFQSKIL